ncbi:DUF2493 domain-containing protein [Streptomyces sp. LBUM 1486]|uniref:SLOG family protein n=1 Tax=Streptomyces scabiei TaxID=1930 RepID=UPI001B31EEB4|nr:SLOG family protein [Streptomyces sp. LBUM 1486]MBP5913212.1 DUF2493 domain-containing protein [Streptomyces sp. LBUM 1486]
MTNPYRVLVTGSRTWEDVDTIVGALRQIRRDVEGRPIVVVHGDCLTGADAIASYLVQQAAPTFGLTEEKHPANWRPGGKLDRAAGFRRNAEMVNLGADVCLAFIRDGSRGASHTADLAEKAGIPTRRFTA